MRSTTQTAVAELHFEKFKSARPPRFIRLNIAANRSLRNAVARPRNIVAVKMGNWFSFIFSIKKTLSLLAFLRALAFQRVVARALRKNVRYEYSSH